MAHDDDPDFAFEPVPGLPETLPRGEEILWQGRPQTLALARSSMGLGWIAGYFVLLAVARVAASAGSMGLAGALPLAIPFLLLGVVACGIVYLVALVQARATLYTITTHRIAMRVGAALTLTLNLPFSRIASADLGPAPGGTGTIALTTAGETRLSYFVLWPHIRPWHMKKVQPALRCIPDADAAARILADAVETRMCQPEISPRPMAVAAE
ncbi:photosynthetic complex putative assembly protein PuhB [Palleronia sp. LCG004]|uniref:photosynthetic complex putative assembly protein PuhB n=1 Tax=Palleronia sp. LCG004 TaxID=3079304 RepID=UPI002943D17E|nr:photosynthetic complex putative assembly protein PuhB [Palleronia sp. LCG004]WOI56167.1 photosynthetic complex putative assembly protein PuhB [Palleronia sp. LCG004]